MLETQQTQVRSLGREEPLGEETATHSSILAGKIPWTEEPGGLQSTGVTKQLDSIDVTLHTNTYTIFNTFF